jgi:hypothetical protein
MATFLVDRPRVVVFPDFQTKAGETRIVLNTATNISPKVEVVFCKNEDEFRKVAAGEPFLQAVTVKAPGE